MEGVLATQGPEVTIRDWLDGRIGAIKEDEGAVHLYDADGNYADKDMESRVRSGFEDIVNRHFAIAQAKQLS